MSRIESTFSGLKERSRKGFIPFVTAGDPDISVSKEIVLDLAAAGADIIELGVPFSDPMADGPIIQDSSMRALAKGVDLQQIITMVGEVRKTCEVPIVLFSYLNPLLAYGFEKLAEECAAVDIDGILVTDAVDEEANELASILRNHKIDLISLVAPTSTDERLASIAAHAGGFIYAVARTGVTGESSEISSDARDLVARMRRFTRLPIAVGFGISTPEQIKEVWRYADAAVVGSAIVKKIANHSSDRDLPLIIRRFVEELIGY